MSLTSINYTSTFIRIFWLVQIVFWGITCGCSNSNSDNETYNTDAEELYRVMRNATFLIETLNEDGERVGTGTGFFVKEKILVTNYHVIKDKEEDGKVLGPELINLYKISSKASTRPIPVDRIIYWSKENDLALLEIKSFLPEGIRPLELEIIKPKIGADIFVLGNPLGIRGNFTTGKVSNFISHEALGKVMLFDAAISPGNSGGPIVNTNGKVVGVVTATFNEGQNINLGVLSKNLEDLLKQNRLIR